MKSIVHLAFLVLPVFLFSQTAISFEADEDYSLGNINQQNDWRTIDIPDFDIIYQPLEQQEVTDVMSSDGNNSLMITSLETFPWDYDGFFGALKNLDNPIEFDNNTEITFDVLIDSEDQSDYYVEFVDSEDMEGNTLIPGVGFIYTGELEVPMVVNGEYEYGDVNYFWETNEWMHVKITMQDNMIKYYINENLIYSTTEVHNENINQILLLTDNYGGHMYIDNITFDADNLSTSIYTMTDPMQIVSTHDKFKLVGDDTDDVVQLNVYDASGKLVKIIKNRIEFSKSLFSDGIYFIKIKFNSGEVLNIKFIK